jgi:hypothetical protein
VGSIFPGVVRSPLLAGQPRELGHFDLKVATTASGDARDAFLQAWFTTSTASTGSRSAKICNPNVVLGV